MATLEYVIRYEELKSHLTTLADEYRIRAKAAQDRAQKHWSEAGGLMEAPSEDEDDSLAAYVASSMASNAGALAGKAAQARASAQSNASKARKFAFLAEHLPQEPGAIFRLTLAELRELEVVTG